MRKFFLAAFLLSNLGGLLAILTGHIAFFYLGLVSLVFLVPEIRKWLQNANGTTTPTSPEPWSVKSDSLPLLQQLLQLNIGLRENWPGAVVVETLEGIINKLRDLIPQLNENHPGSELTWVVNRMVEDYLPRIVRPFLALDADSRTAQQENLLNSLTGLQKELEEVTTLLREQNTTDFRAKASFLRARFNIV